jgi:hypothetical protein
MPYRCARCQCLLSTDHLLGQSGGTIPPARVCNEDCAAAWVSSRPFKTEWEWKRHSEWIAGFRIGYRDHPFFVQPRDDEIIWRYLDLRKLSDLLECKKLYLSAAHLLGDPHEGSLSKRTVERFEEAATETARQFVEHGSLTAFDELQRRLASSYGGNFNWERHWTYVSCWHINAYESAGMWAVYGKVDSVAIRSTYGRLRECLAIHQEPPFGFPLIARVKYLDYSREAVATNFVSGALLHKQKEYEHENELRVLLPRFPLLGDPGPEGQYYDVERAPIAGVKLEVDLSSLVESLVIAPNATPAFEDYVRFLVNSSGLTLNVQVSSLSGRPIF